MSETIKEPPRSVISFTQNAMTRLEKRLLYAYVILRVVKYIFCYMVQKIQQDQTRLEIKTQKRVRIGDEIYKVKEACISANHF